MPYPNFVAGEPLPAASLNSIIGRLTAAEAAVVAAQARADAAYSLIPGNSTVNVGALGGTISLSQFTGTHDQKLAAAFSYAAAQTYKPAILLEPGIAWNFSGSYQAYDGLRLIGNPVAGYQRKSQITTVRINSGVGAASFLVGSTTTYNGYIANISFQGDSAAQFCHYPASAGTMYAWVFRDLMFDGFKHVFGQTADYCSMTLVSMLGAWNIGTPADSQLLLRGSDCTLFPDGSCNFGNGVPGTGATTTGPYLMKLDSFGKCPVGGIYFTAYQGWRALEIKGTPSLGLGLYFTDLRCEGRNKDDPSYGSLIKVKSGRLSIRDSTINYAMAKPAGHTDETDLGIIQVYSGAKVRITNCDTDRAATPPMPETTPFLYVMSGGKARISNMEVGEKGGAWTGLPR